MNSAPATLAGLSPAQRRVLIAVKRRGEASVEGLAEALGITRLGFEPAVEAMPFRARCDGVRIEIPALPVP